MRRKIVLLGATGSIGRQCLDILKYSFDYELVGVSLNGRFENLEPYLFYFDSLRYVAIRDADRARLFKERHPSYEVLSGEDCNVLLVQRCKETDVFNALMGNAGLAPTLEAIEEGRDLFLSNKESIVIGSSLLEKAFARSKSQVYPVDSEHVALAKLLDQAKELDIPEKDIETLYVTASGGALRDLKKEELASVTPDKVLSHPTWNMGSKITVDSATMVNKGFEKIEAAFLFHFPLEKVKAIICRESLVHALLAYTKDGRKEYLYEYSPCDMKVAIAYALSKGTLKAHRNNAEDEKAVHALSFSQIDPDFYPLFDLTVKTYRDYGNVGMILYNYVDTYAIDAFLKGEIGFLDIQEALKRVYDVLADVREELAIGRLAEIESRLSDRAKEIVEEIVDRKRRKP